MNYSNFIESKLKQHTSLFLKFIGCVNYNLINENSLRKITNKNNEVWPLGHC
jgi:hypothetical protein